MAPHIRCPSKKFWRKIQIGLPVLVLATTGSASLHSTADPRLTVSHGYAAFGELKYGKDFKHFDYADPNAVKGGEYRYAQTGTFDSLNMVALLGTTPPRGLLPIFDTLLQQSRDEPASYYCLLCTTLSWPDDLSWIEFDLDPKARWHDGRPVTADDVIFTYEAAKGLTTPLFSRVPQIVERVEKRGLHKVRFHLTMKNNPTLPIVIGMMPIQPRHKPVSSDLSQPTLNIPLGSGPYRVGRVSPGRFMVLERVSNYWGADKPLNVGRWNFDQIRQNYYRDASLENEAFFAGLSDLRLEVNAANIRQQKNFAAFQSGEIKREVLPYDNGTFYNNISFNVRRPILADRAIREAMFLAYDFEWTRKVILGGDYGRVESNFPNSAFEATGLPDVGELALLERHRESLPAEIFTREPWVPLGGTQERLRANLLRARNLLKDAGYHIRDRKLIDPATNQPIELELLAYSPLLFANVVQFIHSMKRLGITVTFRSVDAAQMTLLMGNYDYDLILYRPFYVPTTAPGVGLALQWGGKAADMPNQLNYIGVKQPAIDDALDHLIRATDRQTVVDSMRVIDRIARWEYYSIPLHHSYPSPVGQLPIAYWNKFGRPAKDPTYDFPYHTLETWWHDPAKAARLTHGAHR